MNCAALPPLPRLAPPPVLEIGVTTAASPAVGEAVAGDADVDNNAHMLRTSIVAEATAPVRVNIQTRRRTLPMGDLFGLTTFNPASVP